ncbi:hypothetical protein ESCOCK368M_16535 [Escherichia coli]
MAANYRMWMQILLLHMRDIIITQQRIMSVDMRTYLKWVLKQYLCLIHFQHIEYLLLKS